MEFIFFAGGALVGTIITTVLKSQNKTHGVIDVDHYTEQCIFHITSAELSDRKTKKAVFKINHDAKISREEHGL